MLVEDDELVRDLAADILEPNGYRVLPAANGVEALRICAEHVGKIELMITDVRDASDGRSRTGGARGADAS